MKILIDIKDSKVAFFLEVLKNFSFVKKATPLIPENAELMETIQNAVNEINAVKAGKLKAGSAKDLINEL